MPKAKSKPTAAAAKPIEIFRSGSFVDAYKRKVEFTPEILARAAKIYDPALKAAPLQRGHNVTSATPAVGWIASLSYDAAADRLRATPEKVALQFTEEVDAGAYRYVSAAFYQPEMPNNPAPGEYYLHHVAALGAAPPAVAGLQPISFSASDEGELLVFTAPLEFGDDVAAAWRDTYMLRLFRSVKNLLIEKFSVEDAEKALPESELSWMADDAARTAERARIADEKSRVSFAQPNQENEVTDKPNADAEALKKQLDTANDKLKELAFAENKRFAEDLVAQRKLPSSQVPIVAALLTRLGSETEEAAPLSFSETIDGKPTEKTIGAAAALKTMLGALPEMVEGGEAAKRKEALEATAPVSFSAPPGAVVTPEAMADYAKATDYAKKNNVDIFAAAKAVGVR